jgi:hypothetical protein
MIGFDEAVAYIHDYMINNPPFDVRQALLYPCMGKKLMR